jgi:hypothetical protein
MPNESPNRDPLCTASLSFLDSCAKSGPPPDADAEILKHIAQCPDCSRAFALRTRIADGLQRAVQSQPESPFLEAKIRRSIRQQKSRGRTWARSWRPAAAAALLFVCLGVLVSYQFGHLRLTRASQDAYISSIYTKVAGILQVGLGDHIHCAVFRKFPEQPPSAAAMVEQLGPRYGDLLSLVQAGVPQEYTVAMAHRCSYRGRKFVHLALRGGSRLLSLVIARKAPGESFEGNGLAQVLSAQGVPIYRGGVQRFAIAGFETRDHLVYLVSDLDGRQNVEMIASLAQPVRALLARLEI